MVSTVASAEAECVGRVDWLATGGVKRGYGSGDTAIGRVVEIKIHWELGVKDRCAGIRIDVGNTDLIVGVDIKLERAVTVNGRIIKTSAFDKHNGSVMITTVVAMGTATLGFLDGLVGRNRGAMIATISEI